MAPGCKGKSWACLVSSWPLANPGVSGRQLLGRPARGSAAHTEGNPSSTQSSGVRVQPLHILAPFPALHTLLCPYWLLLVSVSWGRTLVFSTCCLLPRFRLSRRKGNCVPFGGPPSGGIFKANCNPSVYNSSHFIRQDFVNSWIQNCIMTQNPIYRQLFSVNLVYSEISW